MMDWTDRHCRYFHRLLAPRALLYTEMVHTGAVLHGDRERHLGFDPAEHPVALQLGGSEPAELAARAAIGAERGYDEINLNCGCPSDRVQRGAVRRLPDGASPSCVAACVAAMRARPSGPGHGEVPDRHRRQRGAIDFLARFVADGRRRRLPHLRRARAQGLAAGPEPQGEPRDPAAALRAGAPRSSTSFPELTIVLNGGIRSPGRRRRAAAAGRRRDDRPRGLREPLVPDLRSRPPCLDPLRLGPRGTTSLRP